MNRTTLPLLPNNTSLNLVHKRDAQRLREQTSRRADEALSEERSRLRSRVEEVRRETMEAVSEVREAFSFSGD